MTKKFLLVLTTVLFAISASAQFEQGKTYVGASLSNVGLSYNGSEKGSFGVQAMGGFFLADDLMVGAQGSYDKLNDVPASYSFGVLGRYYIEQNGLYLGVACNYRHYTKDFNDFMPGVRLGYAFFLGKQVTVEPELYYDQSFKNHGDYSTIGLRIGVGIYL